MLWWVALAWAQDEADGRLPGAMPIRLSEVPPAEVAPAKPPPPEIDHSKITVIERPGPVEGASPLWWLPVVLVGVFGAVLGGTVFASRLVAPAGDEPGEREQGSS
jgi:hypothetical protein